MINKKGRGEKADENKLLSFQKSLDLMKTRIDLMILFIIVFLAFMKWG